MCPLPGFPSCPTSSKYLLNKCIDFHKHKRDKFGLCCAGYCGELWQEMLPLPHSVPDSSIAWFTFFSLWPYPLGCPGPMGISPSGTTWSFSITSLFQRRARVCEPSLPIPYPLMHTCHFLKKSHFCNCQNWTRTVEVFKTTSSQSQFYFSRVV